jgi:hypothetical protein
MKNTQQGYYTLPNGQQLHFSINAWYILEEDTGFTPEAFLNMLAEEAVAKEANDMLLLDLLTDLVYSAARAYDLEEGVESNYNRFKIRAILVELGIEGIAELNEALLSNSTLQYSLGKTAPQQKNQN